MESIYLKWIPIFLLGLFLSLAFYQGLESEFQFDDYANVVKNDQVHIEDLSLDSLKNVIFSGHSGALMRPVSMITFSLNYFFSGLDPYYFKLTNLVVHIFNSILVFLLTLMLSRCLFPEWQSKNITTFAFLVALIWGLSPINLTSVLYVVQRMTSLSAFFVFLGMYIYVYVRSLTEQNSLAKSFLLLAALILVGFFAILSKENGALLFAYVFLIEMVIFRGKAFYPVVNKPLLIFFSLSLFLPVFLILVYTLLNPSWIFQGYASTSFSLAERLLTEARVLWSYISWILLPNNNSLSLFHDDIIVSTGWLRPLSTLFAVIAHAVVFTGVFILWFKNKLPGLIFGVMLFYMSHLIESTILPLELVHEHRNYIGVFGLAFSLVYLVHLASNKLRPILLSALLIYSLFLLLITMQRASDWGKGLESALIEAAHHPMSAAAHYEVGRQYTSLPDMQEESFSDKARQAFMTASELDKKRADALFALIMMSVRKGEQIDNVLLAELNERLMDGPVYASHASWLKILVSCYKKNDCSISENQLMEIIQSALNNPRIANAGLTTSVMFSAAAEFLASVGNYSNALEMSINAVNHNARNQVFIIDLINLSLHFRDLETAEKWLKVFEERDYFGAYKVEIQRMHEQLAQYGFEVNGDN